MQGECLEKSDHSFFHFAAHNISSLTVWRLTTHIWVLPHR